MIRYLLVALGSATGGVCRYGLAELVMWLGGRGSLFGVFALPFPVATLLTNWLGCLVLSTVQEAVLVGLGLGAPMRLLLTTGFCGGFTTYSTFNYEVATLAGRRGALLSGIYLLATVLGCLLAHGAGLLLGRALGRR